MVLCREFFTGSIQIIPGGKLLGAVAHRGRVSDAGLRRKGLRQMLLEGNALMIGHRTSPVDTFLASAHPAFQLLSEVTSPGAASDPPEITEPHDLRLSSTSYSWKAQRQPKLVVRNPGDCPSSRPESNTQYLYEFGKRLNFSKPQFPHQRNGKNSRVYLLCYLSGLKK